MKPWNVIGVVGVLVAGAVWAAPKLDVNGDGTVTLDEFKAAHEAAIERRFHALDTDGNGSLSQDELAAARQRLDARRHAPRQRIDTDGDGKWSLAELQAVRPSFTVEEFNRLDRNGDGLISVDERPNWRQGPRGPVGPEPQQ